MPDGYIAEDGRRDLRRFVTEATKDWESHAQRLAAAREAARPGREPLSLVVRLPQDLAWRRARMLERVGAVYWGHLWACPCFSSEAVQSALLGKASVPVSAHISGHLSSGAIC